MIGFFHFLLGMMISQLINCASNIAFAKNLTVDVQLNSISVGYSAYTVFDTYWSGADYLRIYRKNMVVQIKILSYTPKKLYPLKNMNSSSSTYCVIDNNNNLRIYVSDSLNQTYKTNYTIDDLSYLPPNFISSYNKALKTVYLLNLSNYQTNLKILGNQTILDIHSSGGLIILYTRNTTSLYNIVALDSNLQTIARIPCPAPSSQPFHKVYYQPTTGFILRVQTRSVQVYNISTRALYKNFSAPDTIIEAAVCKSLLVYGAGSDLIFYTMDTWQRVGQVPSVAIIDMASIQCFQEEQLVAVFFDVAKTLFTLTNNDFLYYYSFSNPNPLIIGASYTIPNTTNTTINNTTTPTNANTTINTINDTINTHTNTSTDTDINMTDMQPSNGTSIPPFVYPNTWPNSNGSNPNSNPNSNSYASIISYTKNITQSDQFTLDYAINKIVTGQMTFAEFNQLIKNVPDYLLKDQAIQSLLGRVFTIIATTNAVGVSRPLTKFFNEVLDDFLFYTYHNKEYPAIVDKLSEQTNILTQIRICPSYLSYLSYDIPIDHLNYQNDLYLNSSMLNRVKFPENVYFLLSAKQIYIINLAMALVILATMNIGKRITKIFYKKYKIILIIYQFFSKRSYWWTIFLQWVQPNITYLAFYGSVQVLLLYSFELFDKFTLFYAIFIWLVCLLYCFMFYPLAYAFMRQKKSKQVLVVGKYTFNGFWLETVLNCFFMFFKTFIHGAFLNNHPVQLILLIIFDLIQIGSTLYMYQYFNYKTLFWLCLLYKIFFFVFDGFLYVFSYHPEVNIPYDFIFFVIIMAIMCCVALKILVSLILVIISLGKVIRKLVCRQKNKQNFSQSNDLRLRTTNFQKKTKFKKKTLAKILPYSQSKTQDRFLIFQKGEMSTKQFSNSIPKVKFQRNKKIQQYRVKSKNNDRKWAKNEKKFKSNKFIKFNVGNEIKKIDIDE